MTANSPLIAALRAIANGTASDPMQADPAAEVARMDRIASEAIARHEARAAQPADPDDDALDGVLLRFWIRAASYPGCWPSALMAVIDKEIRAEGSATPAAYRRALLSLARDKCVNLPGA